MAKRDIIVVGGSAGGIEALLSVVRSLPQHLPAAILVVVHVPACSVSRLPEILARAGALPAAHARDGEAIEQGRIYIAPPDQHLLVRQGHIELTRGPRENHSRPAIDPLFRSAACAYGERVVGVILSGALYDGAAGLLAITGRGGVAIVQDPGEAAVPSMPRSALNLVDVDRILPALQIGNELIELAKQEIGVPGDVAMVDWEDRITRVISNDFAELAANAKEDDSTVYTCPDCGGVLWQTDQESGGWFRCHVGHAYAPEVLLGQKAEQVEAALWSCVRLLKEKATLTRQAAARSLAGGNGGMADRIDEQAQLDEQRAMAIRELLEALPNIGVYEALLVAAAEELRKPSPTSG